MFKGWVRFAPPPLERKEEKNKFRNDFYRAKPGKEITGLSRFLLKKKAGQRKLRPAAKGRWNTGFLWALSFSQKKAQSFN